MTPNEIIYLIAIAGGFALGWSVRGLIKLWKGEEG